MFLEDFAATFGVVIAAAGVGITQATGCVTCESTLTPTARYHRRCRCHSPRHLCHVSVGCLSLFGVLCLRRSLVVFDSIASVMVGALLGGVAVRLVNMNKSFLLGHAVDSGVSPLPAAPPQLSLAVWAAL